MSQRFIRVVSVMPFLLLCALAFSRLDVAWKRNRLTVYLLRSLDINLSLVDTTGILYPLSSPSVEPSYDEFRDDLCYALWLSRLSASKDLAQAQQIVKDARFCPRMELVKRWQGQLAWLAGQSQQAIEHWRKLPAAYLINWGESLIHSGELNMGRALLKFVIEENMVVTLDKNAQVSLYQMLGDLAREESDIEEAVDYYQKAWEASGFNYKIGYSLGLSYAEKEDCRQAVEVWKVGLQNKPELESPLLDASYLIQLATCQIKLEDFMQAQSSLDAAQDIIDRYHITRRQNWLDRVRRNLQERIEP